MAIIYIAWKNASPEVYEALIDIHKKSISSKTSELFKGGNASYDSETEPVMKLVQKQIVEADFFPPPVLLVSKLRTGELMC